MKKQYFSPADILLPKTGLEKWAVIACDQYTSEPEYWEKVKEITGGSPSAFNIILPEVYLKNDNSKKIAEINENMRKYLNDGVFNCFENTYILTVRKLKNGKERIGILGLIDLEDYSYETGAKTPIRATEKTVIERIPARVEIRKGAVLEIPHIMLLINDKNRTVIEPAYKNSEKYEKLYDFTLMQDAGSIKGYAISKNDGERIEKSLSDLALSDSDGFLFAVGDGNHSLAAAKEYYKSGKGPRYALAEVVNIHDSSLQFEPIYRVLFGVKPETVITEFTKYSGGEYAGADAHKYTFVFGNTEETVHLKKKSELAVADLQIFLDEYIDRNPTVKIDYIHGEENLKKLSNNADTLGFLFGGMEKDELFSAVSKDGSLPRKTFSMGHADDKRFYLEARKIQ